LERKPTCLQKEEKEASIGEKVHRRGECKKAYNSGFHLAKGYKNKKIQQKNNEDTHHLVAFSWKPLGGVGEEKEGRVMFSRRLR
jgi:hypothetical protein